MPLELNVAMGQSQGRRNYQEDRCEFKRINGGEQDGLLVVLADGMGGHAAGAEAAELAVETFVLTADRNQHDAPNYFLQALDACNRAIGSEASKDSKKEGMGCTLIGAHISKNSLIWISVGDSLLLVFRDGKISRLNADHSMAPQLDAAAKRGEITWKEAKNSSSRNALLSAVNGGPIDHVDQPAKSYQLNESDWLIIASDGLDTLEMNEIENILCTSHDLPASKIVEILLDQVETKKISDQDNTSVVALNWSDKNANATTDEMVTVPIKTRRYPSKKREDNKVAYVVLGLIFLISVIGIALIA